MIGLARNMIAVAFAAAQAIEKRQHQKRKKEALRVASKALKNAADKRWETVSEGGLLLGLKAGKDDS